MSNLNPTIAKALDAACEPILDYLRLAPNATARRIDIVAALGLSVPCYPKGNEDQRSRSWLAGILLRRLEDRGLISETTADGRKAYTLTNN